MKYNHSIILLNALPDKKIKSLGNKYLIKINRNINIVDHQIKTLRNIFSNPEIIIIGGFDSKRLQKYLNSENKYKDIKYIEHDIDSRTNVGRSIQCATPLATTKNLWIINANILLNNTIVQIAHKNLSKSFVITSKMKGGVGYISDSNGTLTNCYYDLPNYILDTVFIHKADYKNFDQIVRSNIDQLYFFEVLNLCSQANIQLSALDINPKFVNTIDGTNSIKRINYA